MPYGSDVSVEHEGKTYSGRYLIEKDLITVMYGGANIKANLGGMATYPDVFAGQLLLELVLKELRIKEKEDQIKKQG